MNNYIYSYYQAIKDGSVCVGTWIELWYEYLIEGFEKNWFYFDNKKADKAIRFIEAFCHHSEGRSDLLKLELWQKAIVSTLFGVLDSNGNRQFREAVVVIGRKNGKTLFASAIIAYMTFMDGEHGSKTFCVAPKLDQADLVYNAFRSTVSQEPELDALTTSRKSDLYIASTESSVKKIAFNAKKADGFNPHLVICDEIASWPSEQGLKQYEVMKSALGARKQPLVLSISTAGYVNEGIYDELIKRCTAVLLRTSMETRLAPFLYMIDDTDKWNDINEIRKSMPNLGVSVSVDYILEEIAIAEGSLSKKAEFMCKYCNIKQNSSAAWLDYKVVDQCTGEIHDLSEFRGSYCVGGIDLSQTTDLTSCCALIEKGGKIYSISMSFMPSARLRDAIKEDQVPYDIYLQKGFLRLSGENYVDYNDVFTWFRNLVEKYEIYPLQVGYDRYSAQYLVDQMKSYGFHMDDVYQGFNLSTVIKELEGEMKNCNIDLCGNNLLKSHFLNVALKSDSENTKVMPIKISQKTRIDSCMAFIDAFTVRQKWYAEIGEQLKNK